LEAGTSREPEGGEAGIPVSLTLAVVEGVVMFVVVGARLLHGEVAPTPSDLEGVAVHAIALSLCGLFAFHFNDLYDLRRVRGFGQFIARLPRALVMTLALAGFVEWIIPGFRTSALSLLETVVLLVAALVPLRAILHHLWAVHPFSRRVLILGTTELAGKLVQELLAEPDLRDVVVGVADDGSGEFKPALPTLRLGSIESLGRIIEGFEPDLIVCATGLSHDPLLMRELLKPRARGIPVEDGVAAYERLTGKIAIEYAAPRAILFSKKSQVSWIALFLARALSSVVALLGLVLLSPFLLPIAILIKLDSEGPVFFLHERVGLGGRPFKLIKFRTMRTGGARSEWAADNGHRTTRVGHWLRRFRIDELPQFLNILQGDMNLVGPRPHPTSNVDLFTEHIPFYGVRCSVRPGVTGWAQIRYGYANNLEEETEKMRYDLHYIRHLSLGLDLRILFETVKVVVTGGRPATLAEGPGPQVLPIYFGIEHQRRSAKRLSSPPVMPGEGVISIEEQRAKGPRVSRDVA
jgi:exopolysaccharide biosynthesis polyprenyl glycosylphosphotransferase